MVGRYVMPVLVLSWAFVGGIEQARAMDLNEWLEVSGDYQRAYLLGWAEGITTGVAGDSDTGREWRSAMRDCLREMTDQDLMVMFGYYLIEESPDLSTEIADHVPKAFVQMCKGDLPR